MNYEFIVTVKTKDAADAPDPHLVMGWLASMTETGMKNAVRNEEEFEQLGMPRCTVSFAIAPQARA